MRWIWGRPRGSTSSRENAGCRARGRVDLHVWNGRATWPSRRRTTDGGPWSTWERRRDHTPGALLVDVALGVATRVGVRGAAAAFGRALELMKSDAPDVDALTAAWLRVGRGASELDRQGARPGEAARRSHKAPPSGLGRAAARPLRVVAGEPDDLTRALVGVGFLADVKHGPLAAVADALATLLRLAPAASRDHALRYLKRLGDAAPSGLPVPELDALRRPPPRPRGAASTPSCPAASQTAPARSSGCAVATRSSLTTTAATARRTASGVASICRWLSSSATGGGRLPSPTRSAAAAVEVAAADHGRVLCLPLGGATCEIKFRALHAIDAMLSPQLI